MKMHWIWRIGERMRQHDDSNGADTTTAKAKQQHRAAGRTTARAWRRGSQPASGDVVGDDVKGDADADGRTSQRRPTYQRRTYV